MFKWILLLFAWRVARLLQRCHSGKRTRTRTRTQLVSAVLYTFCTQLVVCSIPTHTHSHTLTPISTYLEEHILHTHAQVDAQILTHSQPQCTLTHLWTQTHTHKHTRTVFTFDFNTYTCVCVYSIYVHWYLFIYTHWCAYLFAYIWHT